MSGHRAAAGGARDRRLAAAYLEACTLELSAPKPGNVHVGGAAHGMRAEDFVRSAQVSAAPLVEPGRGLGERICRAVQATRDAVGCNTNLGIVLLCAPLLAAAAAPGARRSRNALRAALRERLEQTDDADARWVYRAIRVAAPGGLGASERQDVREEPTVSLQQAMRLAAHRDRIALQYCSAYADVFEYALPALDGLRSRLDEQRLAIALLFVQLLGRWRDSHVERKFGAHLAEQLRQEARELGRRLERLAAPQRIETTLLTFDAQLKQRGINPGTSADLVVATLLATQLCAPPRTRRPMADSFIDRTEATVRSATHSSSP